MSNRDNTEQFKKYVFFAIRTLLIATAIFAIISGHWKEVIFLAFTLFMTFLPRMLEKQTGLDYPGELEILIFPFLSEAVPLFP